MHYPKSRLPLITRFKDGENVSWRVSLQTETDQVTFVVPISRYILKLLLIQIDP